MRWNNSKVYLYMDIKISRMRKKDQFQPMCKFLYYILENNNLMKNNVVFK